MLTEVGIELGLAGGDAAAVAADLAGPGEDGVRAAPRWGILQFDRGVRLLEW